MPKSTAVWLVENTMLTFDQIAEFCDMHPLEVQAIADGDSGNLVGLNPISNNQLSKEEVERCEKNSKAKLILNKEIEKFVKKSRKVKNRYTPMSQRKNRPDGIAWIVKNHPEVPDSQICKLLRTTKPTIEAIRSRTHANISEITPKNPVALGLCSELDLAKASEMGKRKLEREANKKK